ncbi:MAG: M1 family aminopeptidase [Bacteroidales bacterium]
MNTVFRQIFTPRVSLFLLFFLTGITVNAQFKPGAMPEIWKQEALYNTADLPLPRLWYTDYDVVFCKLDLHLERNTVYVEGNVTTQARSVRDVLSVYTCELIQALTVDSVHFNGVSASFTHQGDSVIIPLNPSPVSGEEFSVRIFYHGLPPTGGYFAGISAGVSAKWGNEVMWTLSQPFNAKQWWPCKQDLVDKYDSAYIFITTDASNKAGSNGLLTAITPMPGDKLRYEWKTFYPIDYYLISAAVADYQEYKLYAYPAGSSDSVFIQNYIYDAPGCLEYYKNELDNTRYHLELFAKLFGPYPFSREKYGHCLVNLGGGMEHQTMGSLGDFNFHLTSHELAHQWFGDHVTCATWNDIWLNEGFATYAQYLSLQYLASQAYADTLMMGIHNYVKSLPGGSVYIPAGEADNTPRIFDGRLSYNKGAAIIHALRGEINNDSVFFDVLKQYLITFGDSVAVGDDFKQISEMLAGTDFDYFYDQWYYGEGFPVYNILYWQLEDTLTILTSQTSTTRTTPFFNMHLEFKALTSEGDTLIRVFVDQQEKTFIIPFKDPLTSLVADPKYWNILHVNSLEKVNTNPDNSGLLIFPNPSANHFNYFISVSDPGPFEAVIYDRQAKKVLTVHLNKHSGNLNTETLSPGLYILNIQGKNFSINKKFIRQ